MYTIFIAIGLCFLVPAVWIYVRERIEYGRYGADFDIAFLVGILGALAGAMPAIGLAIYIGSRTPLETVQETYDLVALADTPEMHGRVGGSFFAVAGRVDQEMHYAYYFRVGPTSYRYRSIPTARATIFEDEENTPYANRFTKQYKPGASNWGITPHVGEWWEEIHIPKGSVLNDFSLDLQ